MTPNSRAPLALRLDAVETPLGDLLVAADADGILRAADFADCEVRLASLLDRRLGKAAWSLSPGIAPAGIRLALSAYFAGDLAALRAIPVRTDGTPFQDAMWAMLRDIAPGHPLAYSIVAQRLGRPAAARAVGHANGANPFCIIIPCHRLVGANGALTGYSGGLERKRWLIAHERRHAAAATDDPAGEIRPAR